MILVLTLGGTFIGLVAIASICYYMRSKKKKKTYTFGINKNNARYFTVSVLIFPLCSYSMALIMFIVGSRFHCRDRGENVIYSIFTRLVNFIVNLLLLVQ